jgi:hypothetical protein
LIAARDWSISLTHAGEVYGVWLVGRAVNYVTEGKVRIQRSEGPFSWLNQRVSAQKPVSFTCARILADSYPVVLNIYKGDDLFCAIPVRDKQAVRLPRMQPNREWEIDVNEPSGGIVYQLDIASSMSALA